MPSPHNHIMNRWGFEVVEATPPVSGVDLTPGLNTYPTPTEVIPAANVTEDCFLMQVRTEDFTTSGAARNMLMTIYRGAAASEVALVPHLMVGCSDTASRGPVEWLFPIHVPAGTRISAAVSGNDVAEVGSLKLRLYGKPSRPEVVRAGSYVESLGATPATSVGTTVTPGASPTEGAWVSLGTLSRACWWWQFSFGYDDTTMEDRIHYFDVAFGDATNKEMLVERGIGATSTNETKIQYFHLNGFREVPSGATIYARAQASGTAASNLSMIAHGVGG